MRLVKGQTYQVVNSVLNIIILNVAYSSANKIVVKLMLRTKSGEVAEKPKYYTLQKSNITHWRLV